MRQAQKYGTTVYFYPALPAAESQADKWQKTAAKSGSALVSSYSSHTFSPDFRLLFCGLTLQNYNRSQS